MTTGEYSVVQFFTDGTHEYVRRFVTDVEATTAVLHYTSSVAVRMGMVTRVIITDGGDNTCFEWTAADGMIYPPKPTEGDEMTEPLTDPIAVALKMIAESVLKGDEALLGVIREVIHKMHALEARIEELELINHSKTSLRT